MGDEHDVFDENLSRLLRGAPAPPGMSPERKQAVLAALRDRFERAAEARRSRTMKRWIGSGAALAAAAVVVIGIVLSDPAGRTGSGKQPPAGPAVRLEDGTRLYARRGTKYAVLGDRRVRLDRGQVLLFVAKAKAPFIVEAPQVRAEATGTIFTVSADEKGSRVAVGQGRVGVRNAQGEAEVRRGQQAFAAPGEPPARSPAPRFSHTVNWAREQLGGEKLFPPDQPRATGELTAFDPWGQEVRLELRKFHVDVVVEDGIARTTVDQTFFNQMTWQLEGTFYFPLPPDASLSRLAMYVNGTRNEGGMVDRQYGRYVYESIVYRRRDPALLEMMEGNVFKMRVFPLFGRREKRIVLSYTQTLPELYRTLRYWFPMEHTQDKAGVLSFRVRVKNGASRYDALSSTHDLRSRADGEDLVLEYEAENVAPDDDFLLSLKPLAAPEGPLTVRHHRQDGRCYLFARWRPELKGNVEPRPRQWFVINDVSASRSSVDVKAQAYVVERLLAEADDGDAFSLMNLDTRVRPWREELTAVRDPEAVSAAAFAAVPERMGATNLQAAFRAVGRWIERTGADNPHVVYLGDGTATDGETRTARLVGALGEGAVFLGLGIGKKVDARFLQAAADATGGVFATINPNEDVRWRVFDLVAALNTPRLTHVHVAFTDASGQPAAVTAHADSGSVADGEALTVLAETGEAPPARMIVFGHSARGDFRQEFDLSGGRGEAAFIPRLWASARIHHLLREDADAHKAEIVALSKAFYVVTPFTSLIVLENEADYKKWKVEMGRKDHWQLYPAPKKIPVIHEPLEHGPRDVPAAPMAGKPGHPRTIEEIVESVQFRVHVPLYGYFPHQRRRMERMRLQGVLSGRLAAAHGTVQALPLLLPDEEDENGVVLGLGALPGNLSGGEIERLPWGGLVAGGTGLVAAQNGQTTVSYSGYVAHHWNGVFLGDGMGSSVLSTLAPVSREALLSSRSERPVSAPRGLTGFDEAGRELSSPVLDGLYSMEGLFVPPIAQDGKRSGRGWLGPDATGPPASGLPAGHTVIIDEYFTRLDAPPLDPPARREFLEVRYRRRQADRERIRAFNRRYGRWYGDSWAWGDFDSRRQVLSETSLRTSLEVLGTLTHWEARVSGPHPAAPMPSGEEELLATTLDGDALVPAPVLASYVRTVGAVPGTLAALTADRLLPLREKLAGLASSKRRDRALAAVDKLLAQLPELSAKGEDTGPFWSPRGWQVLPQPWDFVPPQCQAWVGSRAMIDLSRYAPALESTWADVAELVLAAFGRQPAGTVEPAAAEAVAAARQNTPTLRVRYLDRDGKPLLAFWAGAGDRFARTRRTSMYLREDFLCDGNSLLHVYPELGLAARRQQAGRRIAALRRMVPHLLPPADELARGFDVRLAKAEGKLTTLRLTPAKPKAPAGKDKRTPAGKLAILLTFDSQGFVRSQDWRLDGETKLSCAVTTDGPQVACVWRADGKELARVAYECTERRPEADPFAPNLKGLVVLDMPLRRPEHYAALLEETATDGGAVSRRVALRRHLAFAQLQDHGWQSPWGTVPQAYQTLLQAVTERTQAGGKELLIGELVLAGSAGHARGILNDTKVLRRPTDHPLAVFWTQQGNADALRKLAAENENTFAGHLAAYGLVQRGGERKTRAIQLMRQYPDSPLLFAAATYAGGDEDVWIELSKQRRWRLVALLAAAQRGQTAKLAAAFETVHEEITGDGGEVPVSSHMVRALRTDEARWQRVLKRSLAAASKRKDPGRLLRFAELAWPNGEKELAGVALDRAAELASETLPLTYKLALAQSLWAMGRTQEAWDLHNAVLSALEKRKLAPSPALLAATARFAHAAGRTDLAVDYELKALQAEGPYMPKRINVHLFRQRYEWLWSRLAQRAKELALAARAKPGEKATTDRLAETLARARRVWETWQRVDGGFQAGLYQRLASLYRSAGQEEAAWRALSSVIDEKPRDGLSYYQVGAWYVGQGERESAQGWYGKAYEVEPTNGDWIWHRAELLRQMGKKTQARALYEEIANKKWQPRFQHYNNRAKKALEKL